MDRPSDMHIEEEWEIPSEKRISQASELHNIYVWIADTSPYFVFLCN